MLGLAVAIGLGNPYLATTKKLTHPLLALAVVGLGAGMDLRVVAKVGAHGILYTVAGIAACLAIGKLLAKALKVSADVGTLISVGTAICGGSAIAAIVPVLAESTRRSRSRSAPSSCSTRSPSCLSAARPRRRPDRAAVRLWAALAIHDTSSVVGAGAKYGAVALTIATTVKLARALWIVPLTLGTAMRPRRAADACAGPAEDGPGSSSVSSSPRRW